MLFRRNINVVILIGFLMFFQESTVAQAVEYEPDLPIVFSNSGTVIEQILETSDGGLFVSGRDSEGAESDSTEGFVLKIDKNGDLSWSDSISEGLLQFELKIVETSDKGFVVASEYSAKGGQNKDVVIIKYDSFGTRKWVKKLETEFHDYVNSIVPTSTGGVIIVGSSYGLNLPNNEEDAYIIKFEQDGSKSKVIVLPANGADSFGSILKTRDGGYLITGSISDKAFGVKEDVSSAGVIIKFDSNWNREWSSIYQDSLLSAFSQVFEMGNGDFIVCGVELVSNRERTFLAKYSCNGEMKEKRITDDIIFKFSPLINGEFISLLFDTQTGQQNLVRLDEDFNKIEVFDLSCFGLFMPMTLLSMKDGGFVVGGMVFDEEDFSQMASFVKYSPKKDKDIQINGSIQTMIADVTIPSVSPDLMINPNLPEGSVSPEFAIENQSVSPIKLELKTFEQTTDTFNDVLPSKYDSWIGLNKVQSQDLALGLIAKEGDGWQTLTTPTSYVAGHSEHEIGIIKPTSSVDFSFDVKHGTAFSEAKTVQYKMVFVFDLLS